MRNAYLRIWNIARKPKKKACKMRNGHCRTWNMARKTEKCRK